MSGPALNYGARLLALALAGGCCSYVAGALIAAFAARPLLRRLEAAGPLLARPARARAWLLGLRLLPLWLSLMVVGGMLVPSFLWLEAPGGLERVDWPFLAAAILGAGLAAWAVLATAQAFWHSHVFACRCRARGVAERLAPESTAWVIADSAPLLAVTGIFRPQLLVSRAVLGQLTASQLRAALRHERAHAEARDNFKRLLLRAAPALIAPRALQRLESAWLRLTEWCADDRSVAAADALEAEPAARALSLATALVRVAGLQSGRPSSCQASCLAVSSLRGTGRDLAARVERLLSERPPAENGRGPRWALAAGFLLLTWCMLQPTSLTVAHLLFEHLLR